MRRRRTLRKPGCGSLPWSIAARRCRPRSTDLERPGIEHLPLVGRLGHRQTLGEGGGVRPTQSQARSRHAARSPATSFASREAGARPCISTRRRAQGRFDPALGAFRPGTPRQAERLAGGATGTFDLESPSPRARRPAARPRARPSTARLHAPFRHAIFARRCSASGRRGEALISRDAASASSICRRT